MAKYADKYETPQALEQGFRELDKLVSGEMGRPPLADSTVLVGESGMFKTHDELAASYTKTATAHGKIKAPEPKPTTEPAKPAPGAPKIGGNEPAPGSDMKIGGGSEPTDEDLDVDSLIEKAGLKKADLVEQWDKEGKLTDDQYAKIRGANRGIGKAIANQLARGMAAESALVLQESNRANEEAYKVVGGKDQLDMLIRVEAPKFVPKDQVEAFDKMLANPKTRVAAVRTLSVMHGEAVAGGKANKIVGGNTGGGSVDGIPRTQQEMAKLMREVQNGDQNSIRILNAMSTEQIEKLQYA